MFSNPLNPNPRAVVTHERATEVIEFMLNLQGSIIGSCLIEGGHMTADEAIDFFRNHVVPQFKAAAAEHGCRLDAVVERVDEHALSTVDDLLVALGLSPDDDPPVFGV
jgi:hypothetical protein